MNEFETVTVPVIQMEDGRTAITLQSTFEFPWVADFVARFPNYFVWDYSIQCWTSPLPDDPPLIVMPKEAIDG